MHSYNYWKRMKKACEYAGVDVEFMSKLVDVVRRKAKGDRDTANALNPIIDVLEPPSCYMTHCKHYGGAYAFCNCGKGLIPGRCKINRDFIKRQYERMEKVYLEGRELAKQLVSNPDIELNNPYSGGGSQDRRKIKLFNQGFHDESESKPIRNIDTDKLKFEWGIPTNDTVDEFVHFPDEGHNEEILKLLGKVLELGEYDFYIRPFEYSGWSTPEGVLQKHLFLCRGNYRETKALKFTGLDNTLERVKYVVANRHAKEACAIVDAISKAEGKDNG